MAPDAATPRDAPPASAQPPSPPVSFGYRAVGAKDKRGLVKGVFDRVAARYDLMNDLMSAGVHRLWKRALVEALDPRPGTRLLDLAGGTGDIAARALARWHDRGLEAVVCDINPRMLEQGRERAWNQGVVKRLEWLCGDAEALPLRASSVDACTIGFGIRNVTDIAAALAEIARVLKPGGRFLCLEFSPAVLPALRPAYDAFSFAVIPTLGEIIVGDRAAYRYLVESIRRFPDPARFAGMIEAAGFAGVRQRSFSAGIAALHGAFRV